MFRYILLGIFVALVASAPAPEPKPKPSALLAAVQTPASTAKLTPLATPIASPLVAPISRISFAAPAVPAFAPYAYAYPTPILAAGPSSYSIEQHGYNIVY